jgi:hypothetical protein
MCLAKMFSEDSELEETSVCSYFEHTANDGKAYNAQFYNLDMIISVGYRVNSKQCIIIRIVFNVFKELL